jgi:glutathione peroxidase
MDGQGIAQEDSMTAALQDIPLKTITGEESSLREFAGKVALVVNVASKCGLTPQYEGLEKLYRENRERGFVVLGFPANNFREQEPGADAEISAFCQLTYAVDFPMFAKVSVVGPDAHPLFAALTSAQPKAISPAGGDMRARLASHGIAGNPEPEILWNFEKFLVGRKGEVVARFSPDTEPNDPALSAAIEHELAAVGQGEAGA